jgi:hypothetical protein
MRTRALQIVKEADSAGLSGVDQQELVDALAHDLEAQAADAEVVAERLAKLESRRGCWPKR